MMNKNKIELNKIQQKKKKIFKNYKNQELVEFLVSINIKKMNNQIKMNKF